MFDNKFIQGERSLARSCHDDLIISIMEKIRRKEKKEQEEMQVKMQRDAFFHLNKELEELNNSSQSNLEKYFLVD